MNMDMGMHEKMELHELLMFKSVCAAKASTMKELVGDQQLKSLLEQDFSKSKQQIQDLKNALTGTSITMNTVNDLM